MIFRCFVTVPLGKCWWNICPWIPPDDRYSDIILFFCSPWLQLLKEIPQAIWYQQQEAGCICKLICWCHLGTCIYHLVSSKWRCVLPRKQRTLPMALCVLQSPSLTSDGIANSIWECQGGQQKSRAFSIHDSSDPHKELAINSIKYGRHGGSGGAPRPFTPRRRVVFRLGKPPFEWLNFAMKLSVVKIRTDETFGTGKVVRFRTSSLTCFWIFGSSSLIHVLNYWGRCLRF